MPDRSRTLAEPRDSGQEARGRSLRVPGSMTRKANYCERSSSGLVEGLLLLLLFRLPPCWMKVARITSRNLNEFVQLLPHFAYLGAPGKR